MIKNIRNSFGSTVTRRRTGEPLCTSPFLDAEGGKISWLHIENATNKQSAEVSVQEIINLVPKRQVQFRENKMNVRLAVQTLSNSTADASNYFQESDVQFAEAGATAECCRIYNNAFDILNCRACSHFKNTYGRSVCQSYMEGLKKQSEQIITYTCRLTDHQKKPLVQGKKKCGRLHWNHCMLN